MQCNIHQSADNSMRHACTSTIKLWTGRVAQGRIIRSQQRNNLSSPVDETDIREAGMLASISQVCNRTLDPFKLTKQHWLSIQKILEAWRFLFLIASICFLLSKYATEDLSALKTPTAASEGCLSLARFAAKETPCPVGVDPSDSGGVRFSLA